MNTQGRSKFQRFFRLTTSLDVDEADVKRLQP